MHEDTLSKISRIVDQIESDGGEEALKHTATFGFKDADWYLFSFEEKNAIQDEAKRRVANYDCF